ncbi:hypothetical protein [Streptomyces sp. enrichment culture]|uniref:hypothetical protein n=1 Tax=Streptomyces sp. enrichment culture TaxID=1795815 RepID=UPI003F57BFBC
MEGAGGRHPHADDWAYWRAQHSRRSAGLATGTQLAGDAAAQAATDAGAKPHAVALIKLRARCPVAGQLMHDRIRNGEYEQSIRALLLGAGRDTPAPAPARPPARAFSAPHGHRPGETAGRRARQETATVFARALSRVRHSAAWLW